jgi:hypothetical protein
LTTCILDNIEIISFCIRIHISEATLTAAVLTWGVLGWLRFDPSVKMAVPRWLFKTVMFRWCIYSGFVRVVDSPKLERTVKGIYMSTSLYDYSIFQRFLGIQNCFFSSIII